MTTIAGIAGQVGNEDWYGVLGSGVVVPNTEEESFVEALTTGTSWKFIETGIELITVFESAD